MENSPQSPLQPKKQTQVKESFPQNAPENAKIESDPQTAVRDYRLGWISRHISLMGRKEVLNGRAKFGIFGAGKEVAQLAMSHSYQQGDTRAGYYRDQTLMLALNLLTPEQLFAALYAHADETAEPTSAGRNMNSHFSTRYFDEDGHWLDQTKRYNSTADTSPTAGQMPRLVGLAYASRLYRQLDELKSMTNFSNNGNEVAFGTIGNASAAEGLFWEALNAIGVLKSPAVISIWDDGYGISVPNKYQFAKGSIGPLLEGFRREPDSNEGYDIYTVEGWNYPALLEAYAKATAVARANHIPAIIHVIEMTQPQGHSTSGSHERYKDEERLQFEIEYDPLTKMREWILANNYATAEELDTIEKEARQIVLDAKKVAWKAVNSPQKADAKTLISMLKEAAQLSSNPAPLNKLIEKLSTIQNPLKRDIFEIAHLSLKWLSKENHPHYRNLLRWREDQIIQKTSMYSSNLYSETELSPLNVAHVPPTYSEHTTEVRGFEVLRDNFDALLERDPRVLIFGEDVGDLGDVNQGVAGLQDKYGRFRVSDTGIREMTIIGQAIGLAHRGLRPIAEIQYLDYILYALPVLSDDLATLQWRTKGGQKAPVIVRTRGHRLEGVWHSGSQMGALLTLLRGMHILVPRNMTQAAGFYNTLIKSDDPAVIVERLNGYRLPERKPTNPGDYTVPLGVPEILREGHDVTLVTYGPNCDMALEAAEQLAGEDISVEVVDIQSLLPFDIHHMIVKSLKKTNRLVVLDEDMPGGASAYIMQHVLEVQQGYDWLDSEPTTITAKPHRPAYGTDGDYFSKPHVEEVIETIYDMMHESNPNKYPLIWSAEGN